MEKDTKWKEFFQDNARYADVINGIGCQGVQLVDPADLTEMDSQSGAKARDQLRKAAMGMNFAIVGIENQEEMDYEFPLRNLWYDAVSYQKQAKNIRKEVKGHPEGLQPGEYLYGFKKDSRLYPIITFLLYYGREPWNGPVCLHDILDFTDIPEPLKEMTADYRINVIDVRRMEDTSVFQTDVRQVFDFIRCSEDKRKLAEMVNNDSYFQNMDETAFDVVSKYTNSKELVTVKDYRQKEGTYNMCKAIRDMIEDGREEGREEGKAIGRAEAQKDGIKALIETCQELGSCKEDTIFRLTDKFSIEEEEACQYMELFWQDTVNV